MYLIYIEMLGHDTSWAQATAIQLCSDKNLAVKKVGAPEGVHSLDLCRQRLQGSSCGRCPASRKQ